MDGSDEDECSEASAASECLRNVECSPLLTQFTQGSVEQEDSESEFGGEEEESSEDYDSDRAWDANPCLHRFAEACRERDQLRGDEEELDSWGIVGGFRFSNGAGYGRGRAETHKGYVPG